MESTKIHQLFSRLQAVCPKPTTELRYQSSFELLIAVILSAQATDKKVNEATQALFLAARNIPYVEVRDVQGLDPVSLVGAHNIVVTVEAVKKIEEWLA